MRVLTIGQRQARKLYESREVVIATFWDFASNRYLLNDSERLCQFKEGFSTDLFHAVRMTFDLSDRELEELLNASISTLERRKREQKPLNPIASERLDRIAAICHVGVEVFEDRAALAIWMSNPNKALGGIAPILLCATEIGGGQVRRVLNALEYGGVA